jgi:hypothetical protein
MPLNEARSFKRSNLTKAQQKEQLAAIYGVSPHQSYMPTTNLSFEEVQKMRALVAEHDRTQQGGIKEFDLNNPPKTPYTHQEFPRLVYHHGKRVHRVAHTSEDLAAALEAGWKKEPFPTEADIEPELDSESAAELAAVEAKRKRK